MEDLVSIITPTYNSAAFISKTIESILAQTYKNWELIITDDCSSDDTVSIVREYLIKDKRIKLFQLPLNSGGGVARNNSIKEARGRYIAFCDSDDRWTPNKLSAQISFMKKKDCAFSYTSCVNCDEEGNEVGIDLCYSKITYRKELCDNFIGCLTAVYDVEKIGKVYMLPIRKRQDWGLWISVLKKCRIGYGIKETLGYYTIRKGSVSSNKLSLIRYHAELYSGILNIPMFIGFCLYFLLNMPTYICKRVRYLYTNK